MTPAEIGTSFSLRPGLHSHRSRAVAMHRSLARSLALCVSCWRITQGDSGSPLLLFLLYTLTLFKNYSKTSSAWCPFLGTLFVLFVSQLLQLPPQPPCALHMHSRSGRRITGRPQLLPALKLCSYSVGFSYYQQRSIPGIYKAPRITHTQNAKSAHAQTISYFLQLSLTHGVSI